MKLIHLMITGLIAGNMQITMADNAAIAPTATAEPAPAPVMPSPPPMPSSMPSPQNMMDKMPIQTDMPRTMMNTAPKVAEVPQQMIRQMPNMPDQMMNAMPIPSGNMPMPMGGAMPMPGNMMGNNNRFRPQRGMNNGQPPHRMGMSNGHHGMGRGQQQQGQQQYRCNHGANPQCTHKAQNGAPNDGMNRGQMMMQQRNQIEQRLNRIESSLQQLIEAQKAAAAK